MRERITVESVNPAFIQYLHSAALVVELWGLQGTFRKYLSYQNSHVYFEFNIMFNCFTKFYNLHDDNHFFC